MAQMRGYIARQSSSTSVIMLIQLPRIDKIMPQRIETAGDGCYRGEERICEPDGKDGILLPERLSARYNFAVTRTDVTSKGKLHQTAY